MSKIARATQLLFGSTAGTNQMAQFGSFAAGTPMRYTGSTITPALVQNLANYLQGWFGAVDGENAPCMEDMNALCYLFAYQLAYICQAGIPEYDAATIYYTGSLVNSGGVIYVSLTDANVGNALTSAANWGLQGKTVRSTTATTVNATITDQYIRVDATAGNVTVNLPAIATAWGVQLKIKKIDSTTNTVTITGNSSDNIDFANTYVLENGGNSVDIRGAGVTVGTATVWDVV
jgi:hypothetical protein